MNARPDGGMTKRVALVTGASRGLGDVVAGLLVSEGFSVVATARHLPELERAAASWRPSAGQVQLIAGDVSDAAHREEVCGTLAAGGRLDLLVNNASELGPSPLRPLAELPLDDLRRVYDVNVVAPLALVQALRPWLGHARGRVVNISSDAAVGGYPGWGVYGASKAALDLLSKTLAAELKEEGISVVSVDPGDMRTSMHQAAYPGTDISDRPLPAITLPFWAWFLHQDPTAVSGHRFRAQDERWELPA